MNKTILVLLLCICCKAWAQVEPQVNLASGTAMLNIPLYTIGDGDLKIPLALTYVGQAIPIGTTGEWVGHNWSLSTDAMVSRVVRGLPDDNQASGRPGWLYGDMATRIKNYTFNDDNNPETCSDEVANWNFLASFDGQDTEPDIFSVALPGVSFNFYFDENGNYHTVPYRDVNMSYTTDPTTGAITSFTIVDEKGVKYSCQDIESVTQGIMQFGTTNDYMNRKYQLERGARTHNYAWRLTKIESPTTDFINFTYETMVVDSSRLTVKADYNAPYKAWNEWANETVFTFGYRISKKIPKEISTRTTRIEFHSQISYDNSYVYLSGLAIYNSNYDFEKKIGYGFLYAPISYTEQPYEGSKLIGTRFFLTKIYRNVTTQSGQVFCSFDYHGSENGLPQLPAMNASREKDDWGFYAKDPIVGLLKTVKFRMGGYTALFYEPNTYFDATVSAAVTGAGARIRKTIVHDGVNTTADRIMVYSYDNADGSTSGRLLYRPKDEQSLVIVPTTLNVDEDHRYTDAKYSEILTLVNNGTIPGPAGQYFKFKYYEDLSDYESSSLLSPVLYGRVTAKRPSFGRSVHEFDIPAMIGDNATQDGEWDPATTGIARPTTGNGMCYEKGDIPTGANQFPYPPNPNYGYARALTRKVSVFDETGQAVQTTDYEYQRIYSATGLRRIQAMKFEEIPTYYHNGSSYVDNRMFLYGKYYINTDVNVSVKTKTERLLSGQSAISKVTSYFYDSPSHRNLTRIEETTGDGVKRINRLKYAADFVVGTSSDVATVALAKLVTDHRTATIIESTTSQVDAGVERFTEGNLSLFKQNEGRVVLASTYGFNSAGGLTDLVPASIQSVDGMSVFKFDPRYRLEHSFLRYDSWNHVEEEVGRDRIIHSRVWMLNSTAVAASFDNAGLDEVGFTNFESDYRTAFGQSGAPNNNYVEGRASNLAWKFPAASTGAKLTRQISNKQSQKYFFSCWIKSTSAGSITLRFSNGTTADLIPAVQMPYEADGTTWKYYRTLINTVPLPEFFRIDVTVSGEIFIDDMAFYPSHAGITYSSYYFPFGVLSETDNAGATRYYSYDEAGRVKAVADESQNIISTFDYQVRP